MVSEVHLRRSLLILTVSQLRHPRPFVSAATGVYPGAGADRLGVLQVHSPGCHWQRGDSRGHLALVQVPEVTSVLLASKDCHMTWGAGTA